MKRFFTKRVVITLLVFLAALFAAIYIENQTQRAPGGQSLTDIQDLETLRSQFNLDVGKTRLILLVSPT